MKGNHRFNNRIILLWKDYKEKRVPALYNEFKKDSILFIGLNPSYSEKGIKQICDESKFFHKKVISALKWKGYNDLDKNYSLILEFEDAAQKKYSYFKTLKEQIADKLK